MSVKVSYMSVRRWPLSVCHAGENLDETRILHPVTHILYVRTAVASTGRIL